MFFRFLFEQPPFSLFFASFLPSPFSLLVSPLRFVFTFDFFFKKKFGFSSPFFFSLFSVWVLRFSFLKTGLFLFHFSFLLGTSCFWFLLFFWTFLVAFCISIFQLLEPKKKNFVFETSHHFLRCLKKKLMIFENVFDI